MIEPVQMYAHVPVLFRGYAQLEQATAKGPVLGRQRLADGDVAGRVR